MSSNIPGSGQPTVPVAQAPDSKHAPIAGAPATNDPAQSSTASALTDSLVGTSRMHEPPRGVGKNAHPGSGPPAGVTLGNIAPSSGIAPGEGSKHADVAGPPATNDPAHSSTSAGLTDSLIGSSRLHENPRGAGSEAASMGGGVTLGNIGPNSGIAPGKGSKDVPIQGPPADAPPAVSSTASALQASMLGTKHMHQPVKHP